MSKSKLGLVVGLVALVVPLFAATGAQADTTAVCVFNGATGGINPNEAPAGTADHPGDTGVQSLQNDNSDGDVLGDTDAGGYTFSTQNTASGRTVCAVDASNPARDGVFAGHITSKGHYVNTVCGTGTAIDDDIVQVGDPAEITTVDLEPNAGFPTPADITDADYNLNFQGGQGTLDITMVDDSDNPDAAESGGTDGFVNITPDETTPGSGNCVNVDVSRFLASGAFTATWPTP